MKYLTSALLVLMAQQSFAASTLFCQAEDATTITAVESPDEKGKLFDIALSIRGHKATSYPNAYAAKLEERNGIIDFMVITDPREGILAVVKGNALIDATGVYEIETCVIGM